MVLSMKRWQGKVAVVTGASAGIGAAIVEKLVEEGMIVVGFARRVNLMKELSLKLSGKVGKFHPVECDISVESNILSCFEYVITNLGPIHVLVNNAAYLPSTTLAEGETSLWSQAVAVNILAVCIATREAVTNMKKNEINGHIIHVNSIAGHYKIDIDNLNIYPATKHAITSLSETLRKEFTKSKTKIKVTSLSPGVVATEIFASAGLNEVVKNIDEEVIPSLTTADIADAITYILSTPPYVNISELTIQPINEDL